MNDLDSAREDAQRRPGPIILVLGLCGTAVSLMQTVVVPLLTELPGLLDTSADNASWLVTVTLLTSVVTTPILSRLADMHGKRRMILVALVMLLAGSLLGAVGQSLEVLIVARAMQGFSPALIPISISMMRDQLPPEKLGGAVALMSATLGIGGAVGLPLSGVIYEHLGWHAVFWTSVCMAVVMLLLVVTVVPESGVRAPGRFDGFGALLMAIGLTALLLGISKAGEWGVSSRGTVTALVVGVAGCAVWAWWELRTGQPLVDLRTSARRPVLLTNVASLLAGFSLFAHMLVAMQEFQLPVTSGVGLGLGMTEAGLAMLPGGMAMVVMAPVTATATRRFGARLCLVAGLMTVAVGYLLKFLIAASVTSLSLTFMVVSVGTAVCFAAMPVLIMRSVPITETAAANGLNTVVRSIGGATCSASVAAVLAAGALRVGDAVYPSAGAIDATSALAGAAAFVGALVGLLIPSGAAALTRDEARQRTVGGRSGAEAEVVVRGRVQRPDGMPVRLAVVSVLERGGPQVDWARADNDGRWSVVLPGPGRYLLVASADGWAPRSELRLMSPELPCPIVIGPRFTVAGVVSRNGIPLEDALVALTQVTGESVGATLTDSVGFYELGMPPFGRYVLTALDAESGIAESQEVVISALRRQFNVVLPGEPTVALTHEAAPL